MFLSTALVKFFDIYNPVVVSFQNIGQIVKVTDTSAYFTIVYFALLSEMLENFGQLHMV